MATLDDLQKVIGKAEFSNNLVQILKKLAVITNAGDPTGLVTPDHLTQRCLDTVNGAEYVATSLAASGWKKTTP